MTIELPLHKIGETGLMVPPIIFGSSSFGNLYAKVPYEVKLETGRQWLSQTMGPVVIDSAGKYGAGMSLMNIGKVLRELEVDPKRVIISNKLGWKQVPLKGPEPTFEVGVWHGLDHDATNTISYQGILDCHEQGKKLLGQPYAPQMLSVHDPDEYLMVAKNADERQARFENVIGAYQALAKLKASGEVKAIGIGAKNWRVAKEISEKVKLDWVMLACALTPYQHERELIEFVEQLHRKGIAVINSAVFNGGFLTGGDYFDYRLLDPIADREIFEWRDKFNNLCRHFGVKANEVCVQFGMQLQGVIATALNTTRPERIIDNIKAVTAIIPHDFWTAMKEQQLISKDYPFNTGVPS